MMMGWRLKVVEVVILVFFVFGFGIDMNDKVVIFLSDVVMVFVNFIVNVSI